VHCDACGAVPVPGSDLPVLLPDDVDFKPSAAIRWPRREGFMHTPARLRRPPGARPTRWHQWLCSCWYFLRYVNPRLTTRAFDRGDVRRWLPVDQYIGGIEHAVLHLLYSRFIVKVLHDAG
jgi:leucyl-tRNA synthetase